MASERGVPVDLYIYDLTNGLAAVLSPAILGRQVEGVWHTAVVVYDREYFYGAGGITSCEPGGTQLGAPLQVERLGETFVPRQLFVEYIQGLAATTYTGAQYRLLEHNCNHFSDEVAQFLCGARVPKHILQQPAQLPPPLRLALTALLDNMLPAGNGTGPAQMAWDGGRRGARGPRADSPDFLTLNSQIEQARWRRVGRAVGAVGSHTYSHGARARARAHSGTARWMEAAGAVALLIRAAQLLAARRRAARPDPPRDHLHTRPF